MIGGLFLLCFFCSVLDHSALAINKVFQLLPSLWLMSLLRSLKTIVEVSLGMEMSPDPLSTRQDDAALDAAKGAVSSRPGAVSSRAGAGYAAAPG